MNQALIEDGFLKGFVDDLGLRSNKLIDPVQAAIEAVQERD